MTLEEARKDRIDWIARKQMNAEGFLRDGYEELASDELASAKRFEAMTDAEFIEFAATARRFQHRMRSGMLPV